MPELPIGLKPKKRPDGKLDLVGTDVTGNEYVARTTEEPGVTERDLQILDVGNRERSTPERFTEFYANERRTAKSNWEKSMDDEYTAAAEEVVFHGLHQKDSKAGSTRAFRDGWARLERLGYI